MALLTKRQIILQIIFILLSETTSSVQQTRVWKCTGKQSQYTYLDCQTDRSLTDGCYYLIHFSQYRPCNEVCDGVELGSRDEERCRAYCPDYLTNYCHAAAPNATLSLTTIPHPSIKTKSQKADPMRQSASSAQIPFQLITVITVLLFAITTVGAVVVVVLRRKKQQRNFSQSTELMPNHNTVAQVEDGRKYLLPSQPTTAHPVQVVGDDLWDQEKKPATTDSIKMVD